MNAFSCWKKTREFIVEQAREARREGWSNRCWLYENAEKELAKMQANHESMMKVLLAD
jgi:hypothetical protein